MRRLALTRLRTEKVEVEWNADLFFVLVELLYFLEASETLKNFKRHVSFWAFSDFPQVSENLMNPADASKSRHGV